MVDSEQKNSSEWVGGIQGGLQQHLLTVCGTWADRQVLTPTPTFWVTVDSLSSTCKLGLKHVMFDV